MDIHNPLDTNTVLDDIIRDSLAVDARKAASSDKVLMRLMQRAQTEVPQLPPLQSAESTAPVILSQKPAPSTIPHRSLVLLRREHTPPIPRQNLYNQITEYREVMELKMWRMIGPLTLATSV